MNQKEKELVGALIGLAKACNVHLKTENTDNIIIQSLACIFELFINNDCKSNDNKSGNESRNKNIGVNKNIRSKSELVDTVVSKSAREQQLEELLQKVREEKLAVAPDCAICLNPCGNTDEYNLDELQSPEVSQNVRDSKMELLNASYKLAFNILHDNIEDKEAGIKALYKALCVISYDVTEERVRIVLSELEECF